MKDIGTAADRALAALPSQGSGELQQPRSASSVTVHHQTAKMVPAASIDFRNTLTPCLALVAPSGMPEDDRDEWIRAAYGTLKGIPLDLLKRGAKAAALKADHPAKIISAIMAEIGDSWNWRKGELNRLMHTHPLRHDAAPVERMVEGPIEVIPQDEINGWPASMRRTALGKGWITQEQFDACPPPQHPVDS